MALVRRKPVTSGQRFYTVSDFAEITKSYPEKNLLRPINKSGGRNHYGHETNDHKGGGHKRRFRLIDFKRDKVGIPGKVVGVEYDPNRSARIALIAYADGEKRYILAPIGLQTGETVMSGPEAEVKVGNALPLKNIPEGSSIHNIELYKGHGGQIVRGAGTSAQLMAKETEYAQVKLPSGEVRKILIDCYASIGQLSNADRKNTEIGKAGRSRWLGRRPHVRGIAKNPVDHPLGGGEGRSHGGRHPVSRTAVPAKGYKTRKNKRTDKFIVKRRPKGVR